LAGAEAAGFAGRGAAEAAGLGFPDMDAPQNGHSSTLSSRTDELQAGQLRNSMLKRLAIQPERKKWNRAT
jgi:hypothetical protein